MRRLTAAGLIVAVLAVLWTGGWFAAANWAGRQVDRALKRVESEGVSVDCPQRKVVGFPFALRLSCGATAIAERRSGATAELAGMTGGASIFAPRTARIELVSPVTVQSALLTGPAQMTWSDADLDVGIGMGGPRSVGMEASDFAADIPVARLPGARLSAEAADGALSPAGDGGTDLNVTFSGLSVSGAGVTMPPFNGTASVRLSPPFRTLVAGRAALQAPLSASDLHVALDSGKARLQADGDVSVDAQGIVDGTIKLRVGGANDLAAFVAALPEHEQRLGNGAIGGLLAFGTPTTVDGQAGTEIVVDIRRGRAKIGPVDVELPRLPL